MRLGEDEGSSRSPELLLVAFQHFLVLASEAASPDLAGTRPWNFYFNSFSASRSSYLGEAVP